MRILFAGTPGIAVPSLRAVAGEFDVVGVLTAPDRTSGRGRKVSPSPVKAAAGEMGLRVLQPERLGAASRDDVASLGADLLVVFAYGRIFGPKFLSLFPLGGINMHPSALPKYRGPSPITAAILGGDSETALTVQRISEEMDAGDIVRQTPFPLDGTETTGSLTEAVSLAAAPELAAAVRNIAEGTAVDVPQDPAAAVYCRLVRKENGVIDWSRPAAEIERMIRAYDPWPRARTTLGGEPLTLLASAVADTVSRGGSGPPGTVSGVDTSRGILIQTGEGILAVTRLQAAGRKPLDFRSFLNGVTLEAGSQLGESP